MYNIVNIVLIVIVVQVTRLEGSGEEKSYSTKQIRSSKLSACQACKMLIDSFYFELQFKTLSSSHSQEEEEIKVNDTTMFSNIFVNLCREDRAKDQCLTLAEKCKGDLKNWWLTDKSKDSDLLNYLCIDKLRYCCPNGRFGPDCNPCPGYPDKVCSNNGKCKGNGTRKGNGQCSCDLGYVSTFCDECAPSYYESYKDENKLLCTRCHSACEGNCSQAGANGCLSCRDGWRMVKMRGCMDVNECFSKRSPCKRNEFCVNNEGSYSCLACDPSCDICTGDGPDMCEKCASGFFLIDNICVNEKNYVSYSDITRYLTYAGLCFATYIIFQNSLWAASIIGICVAIYVTVSEYMLGTLSSPVNFLPFSKIMEILENMFRN